MKKKMFEKNLKNIFLNHIFKKKNLINDSLKNDFLISFLLLFVFFFYHNRIIYILITFFFSLDYICVIH